MSSHLRIVLKSNALFSGCTGLLCLTMPNFWSSLMNITPVFIFYILGIGLLLFAAFVAYTAIPQKLSLTLIYTIIIQDALWVLMSSVLLTLQPFQISVFGNYLMFAIMLIVALFGFLQYIGIRKLNL